MAAGQDVCWILASVLVAVLSEGVFGESVSAAHSEEEGHGLELGAVVGGVVCVVVLVAVIALCSEHRVHVENMDRGPPYWAHSLEFRQDYNGGLSAVSDGLTNLSPYHVTRTRLGMAVTDGARWDVGFTQGKHVFEVVWPVQKNRGTNSSIGVGTLEVPIKHQGRLSLAGHHSQSWGYDLSSRKMIHANKKTGNFQKQMPDRFFVYLDLDSGKIGFGEDVRQLGRQALFYGYLVNGIRLNKDVPLHLMIGMCAAREEVQVYYIGTAVAQGGFDLTPPEQGPNQTQTVVHIHNGQQQQPQEVKVQAAEPVPAPATY